jgi:hypothetical protein
LLQPQRLTAHASQMPSKIRLAEQQTGKDDAPKDSTNQHMDHCHARKSQCCVFHSRDFNELGMAISKRVGLGTFTAFERRLRHTECACYFAHRNAKPPRIGNAILASGRVAAANFPEGKANVVRIVHATRAWPATLLSRHLPC